MSRVTQMPEVDYSGSSFIEAIDRRIGFKENGKILVLDPEDVIGVQAQGNYVQILHRSSKSHIFRASISLVAEHLKAFGFVRIHRSAIVNGWLVEELRPKPTGKYIVRMKGGREFVVARNYRRNLRLLAGSWLGTDPFPSD
ncbi:MAG: LytTR family transcriptional regulator [Acidobacteriaceae bacterium]|nr:LytTR family transcriptional regulator [Acidobacteriaceae bacterium]MBV9483478.1 LytTR family transcriptional regulator [Acidobacteriota bacterium]